MAARQRLTAQQQRDIRRQKWREEREQEEQQQRSAVIAEFDAGDVDATLQAMAGEILRYRQCVTQRADAIAWMQAGAPFIALGPRRDDKPAGADPGDCTDDHAAGGT